MRQETGNNITSDNSRVSVRIDSGGHSFSVTALPKKAFGDDAVVELVVATHKTLLVPSEIFEPEAADKYLAQAGLACADDEQAIYASDNGMTAVFAVARTCIEAVNERFGSRARFTTPLLGINDTKGCELHIRTQQDVSFFRLYTDGVLKFAEAMRTGDSDEILYYTALLDREYPLADYLIYIKGDNAAGTAKLLKRYFKGVKCE